MDQHHAASISRLPTAVLAKVLQYLPQQQRLQHCALVGSTWAAAAAAATTSISMQNLSAQQVPSLQAWVGQYSSQLQHLYLNNPGRQQAFPQLSLPCAGLVQLSVLHLSNLEYQLQLPACPARLNTRSHGSSTDAPPASEASDASSANTPHELHAPSAAEASASSNRASSSAGSQACAPVLPRLVQITAQADFSHTSSFLQLCAATALTHLELRDCWSASSDAAKSIGLVMDDDQQQPEFEQGFSVLLQHLPKLQQLWLSDLPASVVEMGLEGASGTLTELRIDGPRCNRQQDKGGASCLPVRLQQLTALRSLHVSDGYFYSSALADLHGLQYLHVRNCTELGIAPAVAASMERGVLVGLPGVLAQLTNLRNVVLEDSFSWPMDVPLQHFSALTASSDLECLDIWQRAGPALPPGAMEHMFGPGRQLQGLTSLVLESDSATYVVEHPEEWDAVAVLSCACISASDVRCLVRACPALEHLGVCNSLQDSAAVQELLHLPQCCDSLSVGGVAFGDAAASAIAQLMQVTELNWGYSFELTDLGLQELTGLTNLHQLALFCTESISQEMFPREDPSAEIYLRTRRLGRGGVIREDHVWQQLDRLCDRSPLCAPRRLAELRWSHAQLQQTVQDLAHRVNGLEKQLTDAQETQEHYAEVQEWLQEL